MHSFQTTKHNNYDVIVYQVHLSEIEQLIDAEPDEETGYAVLGNWLIKGRKHYVDKIKGNFDYRKIVDDCTAEQNKATPLGDWYAELTYPHRVRSCGEVKALTVIMENALALTSPKSILVCWKSKFACGVCDRAGVCHEGSPFQGRKQLIQEKIQKAIYHLIRTAVGFARILKYKKSSADGNGKKTILVGSSDIYRKVNEHYENPVTGEVRRELEALIYMSSPHDSGERSVKLKAYIHDKRAIAPEAVVAYFAFKYPIKFLAGLTARFNPFHKESGGIHSTIIQAFKVYLSTMAIDAVILSGEYSRIPRSAIMAANALGIPTAGMQHGVITPRHPGYTLQDYSARASTPKSLLLHGEAYLAVLENLHGHACPSCWVVGNPATKEKDSYRKPLIKARSGRDGVNVLFASQPQLRPLLMDAFGDIPDAWKNNDITATFKLHPAYEKKADFFNSRIITDFFKSVTILPMESNVDQALANADIVVSRNSTILQEALFQGVPTIEVLDQNSDYSFNETFGRYILAGASFTSLPGDLADKLLGIEDGSLVVDRPKASIAASQQTSINMPYATITPWLSYALACSK
jgi:hypothetical protein